MTGDKTRLGFIGTGLMGAPMAARLLTAGFPLTVWNRSRDKLGPLLDQGAKPAGSPAEVAAAAEVVLMCLTDSDAVEEVILGPGGIAEGATGAEGSARLVIDHSSIRPDATRDMAGRLRALSGAGWVDAPVSGGVRGAQQGSLAIMAGGADRDIETARPIVAAFSGRFTHMGELGAGQVTKLVNQIIVTASMVVTAEATDFARRAGVDPAKLTEALKGGFADSLPLQIFQPRMAGHVFEPVLGASHTLLKDVETALSVGRDCGATLALTAKTRDIMEALMAKGHGAHDIATLVTLYEDGDLAAD